MKKLKQHNPLEGSFSAVVGDEFITGKVSKLVELSKDYPTIKLPLSKIPNIPHHSEPEKNIYIVNSSLSYPIIVMVDEDGEVERVLDGNHRIQKALYLGKDIINAKLIPKKDMKRFFGKSNLQESIRKILREEFNYSDILDEVANHILSQISDFNEDMVTPLKLYVFGSRIKKNHDDDSDLDILFIYDGNLKSKYLQNILNEDLPFGDEINLDIVPTNINEETFLNRFNMDYDVENLPVFYFDRQ